jgi:hypothetical protein
MLKKVRSRERERKREQFLGIGKYINKDWWK